MRRMWFVAASMCCQPVMFSAQSKSVGRHEQGAVVGLRQTLNRLSAIIVPPVMGLIADLRRMASARKKTWGK